MTKSKRICKTAHTHIHSDTHTLTHTIAHAETTHTPMDEYSHNSQLKTYTSCYTKLK